ncbi:hypothetical protein ANANG_G00112610 [Anguilla anguilla]|uniref:Uncharacterized protein n=1 Tax=Anguilla anguilla TaxID=7936 RepID=A0A9D3MLP8_ANGAN|nr:hypothetical protein ANANG_G00112610 [Anguilla anguilla]
MPAFYHSSECVWPVGGAERHSGRECEVPSCSEKGGSLMHSGATIGDLTSGRFTAPRNEKYRGRLQWDSSTGFFSLSGLKMEDIGV